MYLYHMTTSANRNYFCYYETEQPCAQGQNQNIKRNSVLYANRFVYIEYEVRFYCNTFGRVITMPKMLAHFDSYL